MRLLYYSPRYSLCFPFFFFQAEDGIRDLLVDWSSDVCSSDLAFVLVANCSPYTYAGSVALQLVPGGSFAGGLAFVAPTSVRPRDVPLLLLRAMLGTGLAGAGVLSGRDVDRLVARCDRPLPLQVDGEDAGDVLEA